MARVHSPRKGWDGVSVGVRFRDGAAEVNPAEHPAAFAYFERAGYRIEHPKAAPPVPERPGDKASKAEWAAYAVARGELTEAEADKLTRDQLAERFGARA